jgi:hypothetical protein
MMQGFNRVIVERIVSKSRDGANWVVEGIGCARAEGGQGGARYQGVLWRCTAPLNSQTEGGNPLEVDVLC